MSGYDDFDFRAQGNQPGQPPASGAAAAAQQQGSQMPPAAEQQPAPAVPPPPRTAGGQLAPAAPPSGQPMATGIPAAQQAPVEHPPMFTPAPPPVPSAIPPIPAPSGGYQTQPAPAANQYPHHHHAGAAVQSAAEHVAAITPASQAKLTSTSGVRGALNKLGLGVGMSKREQAHAELVNRIRTPLAGNYRVAVITFKGGAGKTPTAAGLGNTLALFRPDRIVLVDADPDSPTADQRTLPAPIGVSYRDVVEHAAKIGTYGQMRGFTGVTHQDLEVLPGGFSLNDEGMKAEDLAAIDEVLERFYNCLLFDMGTDLRGELASTILERCDAVVLVTNTRKRSIDLAAQTIDYLRTQGHERLLERMVVAITVERPKPAIDPEEIRAGFSRQLRPVHIIPFDPHLAEDGVIDVRLLAPKTALAFEEIAASVTEGFSASHIRWEA